MKIQQKGQREPTKCQREPKRGQRNLDTTQDFPQVFEQGFFLRFLDSKGEDTSKSARERPESARAYNESQRELESASKVEQSAHGSG